MDKENLTGRQKDISAEFDQLEKRRESDMKRMYHLQGAHALLDDLIKQLDEAIVPEEKPSGRKPRGTKVNTRNTKRPPQSTGSQPANE